MTILRRKFAAEIEAKEAEATEESRTFELVASTTEVDSYGEIVVQDWDLKRFEANPVILWSHDAKAMPIGKGANTRVEDNKLRSTVTLVSDEVNPKAGEVWKSVKAGNVKGVSVGFTARKAEIVKAPNGDEVFALSGNELLEISICSVGANPGALIERVKSLGALMVKAEPEPEPEATPEPEPTQVEPEAVPLPAETPVEEPPEEKVDVLALTGAKSLVEAKSVLDAWRASHESAKTHEQKSLIDNLRREGRAAPAQEDFLRTLSVDQLRTYAKSAPVILNRDKTFAPPEENSTSDSWRGLSFDALVKASYKQLAEVDHDDPALFKRVIAARKAAKSR